MNADAARRQGAQDFGDGLALDTGHKPSRRATKQAKVKAMLAAKRRGKPEFASVHDYREKDRRARAWTMARTYGAVLAEYRGEPTRHDYAPTPPNARMFPVWLRAADLADALGVDYETFVKAQFYWFDRWFHGRRPLPYQLSTSKGAYSAVQRITLYQDAVRRGKVSPDRTVRGPDMQPVKASPERLWELSQRTLESLMKNWGKSEEEILRVFARDICASDFFDLDWLRHNQTYRRLKQQGDL